MFYDSWKYDPLSPRIADLCCGAGGSAKGLYDACKARGLRARIVGFDVDMQMRYPYSFVQRNVLGLDLSGFDFVWASPPCQAFSSAGEQHRQNGIEYPDILDDVREMLRDSAKPYIIENVPEAPLRNPVMLCGTMFPPLRVFRHRHFESNFTIPQPAHEVHVARTRWYGGDFVTLTGHPGNRFRGDLRGAMGIDWMLLRELTQAIPPAYTRYLGQFIPIGGL